MKVKIGPYKSWVGAYQIAEMLCFWAKPEVDEYGFKRKPQWVHDFGTWLAENRHGDDSWLTKVCNWVESHRHRHVYVKIDRHDTYNMDHTLAFIILPMLRQLQATKHGAPVVADEDVPDFLKSVNASEKENDWDTDDNWFLRWDWVLGEMIFAFESKLDDNWQDKYATGNMDWDFEETDESGLRALVKGPNHTYEVDYEGMQFEQDRISNGFRLFGKYYECLWD